MWNTNDMLILEGKWKERLTAKGSNKKICHFSTFCFNWAVLKKHSKWELQHWWWATKHQMLFKWPQEQTEGQPRGGGDDEREPTTWQWYASFIKGDQINYRRRLCAKWLRHVSYNWNIPISIPSAFVACHTTLSFSFSFFLSIFSFPPCPQYCRMDKKAEDKRKRPPKLETRKHKSTYAHP